MEVPGLESSSEEEPGTIDTSMLANIGSSEEESDEPYYIQEGRQQYLEKNFCYVRGTECAWKIWSWKSSSGLARTLPGTIRKISVSASKQ